MNWGIESGKIKTNGLDPYFGSRRNSQIENRLYLLFCSGAPLVPHGSVCGMKQIAYCLYREDEFHIAQCLNVDVSSFGTTREEAVINLKEAVELYFEGETSPPFTAVSDVSIGQEMVNA